MANKKKTKADRPKTDNPNVKGLHAEVLEQPITQTLEINYMPPRSFIWYMVYSSFR